TPRGLALCGVLLCIFLLLILRRSELRWNELLLLILGTTLALDHQRMATAFGILAAPTFSRLLSTSWEGYSVRHDHPWANGIMMISAAVIAGFAFPNRQYLARQVDQGNPVAAVEFIRE